jgi:hypothetical protein
MAGRNLGFVVAFTLAAGCLVASASPAGAAEESKLTYIFDDREFDEPPDTDPVDAWVGKLKSDESACMKGRTIKIFRAEGSPDLIGTDVSNAKGKWAIEEEDPGDGFFKAKVAKERKGDIVCGADSKGIDNGDYEGPVDNDGDDYFSGHGGDCDDTDFQRHPGVIESLNFKDDDCDGVGDDNGELDQDGDGITGPADCDDTVSSVYPGATELFDGLDQNCNGQADEIFYEQR